MMTIEFVTVVLILAGGIGIAAWQFRWLLRAYRAERDRQPPQQRSSRLVVLVLALVLFTALAAAFDLQTARRLAVGAIVLVGVMEGIRRRWAK